MFIPEDKTLVLFDGYCHLCSRTVQFILKHDKQQKFIFGSLQSEAGKQIRKKFHIPDEIDSVIVIHSGKTFYYSESVFIILKNLGGFRRFFLLFRIIPLKCTDCLYRWIAGKRYRWFRKRATCFLPSADYRDRFI